MIVLKQKPHIEILHPKEGDYIGHPYFSGGVSAGFPSPADDFKENRISLDEELIKDSEATFYARVNGESMIGAGMSDGDLLIVDKSIEPYDGCVAVCFIEGEFTVKRIKKGKDSITLMPENPKYKPLVVSGDATLIIWGVVTYTIKNMQRR